MTGPSDPESGQPPAPHHEQPEGSAQRFWYEQQPGAAQPGAAQPPRHEQPPAEEGQPQSEQQPEYATEQPYGQQQADFGRSSPPPPSGYFGAQPPFAGYRPPPRPGPRFGVVGAVLAALGAACLIVSFTAVNWFSGSTRNSPAHFSNVHDVLNVLDRFGHVAARPAQLYFGWLGWALLAAVLVLAVLAVVPSPLSAVSRLLGFLVAVAGIVMTFLAIKLTKGTLALEANTRGSYGEWLKHARIGFYLAVAGFLLAGIGAAFGPRRR
ncbi:MAG: hypothetical protein QOH14_433 [Pseudonocardiales bacterium]|nr:hypothetical protein [Pseudonocardiales bacterium]